MATFKRRIGRAAALAWLAAGWGAWAQGPGPDLPPAPAKGPVVGPVGSFGSPEGPAIPARGACCPVHGRCRRGWFGRHRACCKQHLADNILGYADQFESAPLGSSLYAINRAQVGNGEAARMAFREYDFEPGSDRLNLRGLDQIHRVAGLAGTTFHPIVIERTPREPGRDEKRRIAVHEELMAKSPFPVPSERILIGPSPSAGLGGIEAEILGRGLLYRTSTGGPLVVSPDTGDVLPLAAPPSGSGTGGP